MNPDKPLKHFVLAFLLAAALYLVSFNGIEYLRYRKGPWQAGFATDSNGVPTLVVTQPALSITNLRILFLENTSTNRPQTVHFRQPRPTPYDVAFGRCIFEDLTFLPGTVTLELFGHEIELLPRVLIVDKREFTWRSGATIRLTPTNSPPHQATPAH